MDGGEKLTKEINKNGNFWQLEVRISIYFLISRIMAKTLKGKKKVFVHGYKYIKNGKTIVVGDKYRSTPN